jgi:hypothetical protein
VALDHDDMIQILDLSDPHTESESMSRLSNLVSFRRLTGQSVELHSRCLRQWFKEIVVSDVTRGDTRGHEDGYPGGAEP